MCVDWLNAGAQLDELEAIGIDFLHVDVIDGHFAPDFTMGSSIVNVVRERSNLSFEYHLMVENPSRIYSAFPFGDEDYITIHQEASRNLHRDLVRIRQLGAKVGLALSPATPLSSLEYVIEELDLVQIMTVNPGYMGQPIVPQVFRKIQELSDLIARLGVDVKISVDGNVNPETIPSMVGAGANSLVLGSSGLFRKDRSLFESVNLVHQAINRGLETRGA